MHPDFLIIGAGALGLSTALELAEQGAEVVVLERGQAGRESTWAGGGILSPLLPWHYGDAVNVLSDYSRGLFADWCASLHALSGVDPELRASGMLLLSPFDAPLATRWCQRHAWRCEPRDGRDFLAHAPAREALWFPDVAQARNSRLVKALRGAVLARGVKLLESTPVCAFLTAAGRVSGVRTETSTFSAAAYVLAAGAWSGSLPGMEILRRRVYPVRGQMLLFKLAPGALNTIVVQDGRYLIPRVDGHILAGSTLEETGFDPAITESARREILAFATRLLPDLNERSLVLHWSGLRPGSPDNIPAIGRHPEYANLFINSGHFRYGVTMAPGSAKLLASLIRHEPPPIPEHVYQIDA